MPMDISNLLQIYDNDITRVVSVIGMREDEKEAYWNRRASDKMFDLQEAFKELREAMGEIMAKSSESVTRCLEEFEEIIEEIQKDKSR